MVVEFSILPKPTRMTPIGRQFGATCHVWCLRKSQPKLYILEYSHGGELISLLLPPARNTLRIPFIKTVLQNTPPTCKSSQSSSSNSKSRELLAPSSPGSSSELIDHLPLGAALAEHSSRLPLLLPGASSSSSCPRQDLLPLGAAPAEHCSRLALLSPGASSSSRCPCQDLLPPGTPPARQVLLLRGEALLPPGTPPVRNSSR
jgi:hypothetical protein